MPFLVHAAASQKTKGAKNQTHTNYMSEQKVVLPVGLVGLLAEPRAVVAVAPVVVVVVFVALAGA